MPTADGVCISDDPNNLGKTIEVSPDFDEYTCDADPSQNRGPNFYSPNRGASTMTKMTVDGSKATYCARFSKDEEWSDACTAGAIWLQEIKKNHFPNTSLFFIHIDSNAAPDTRISRYYGVFKRKAYSSWTGTNSSSFIDDSLIKGNDALYFGATKADSNNLPKAIDVCRVNRDKFLVISNSKNSIENVSRCLAKRRLEGTSIRIDLLTTLELFLDAGLTPIRIWETHPVPEIFIEVYSNKTNA